MRTWLETPDINISDELLQIAGGQPLVAQALARRGYLDPVAARAFLDPACYSPADPRELPGMERAVERLLSALGQGEHILVWGDFDVDGQTATTLLVSTLRELGGQVSYHIPVRAQESHGVNLPVLKSLLETGNPPTVVLTCDTGIAAHPAIAFARERRVDVIITDHHELPRLPPGEGGEAIDENPHLPPAYALVTPRLLPPGHSLGSLPGVGVAYKLAEALFQEAGNPVRVEQHLDLAALGIVADVAMLTGEARYLLQRGLGRLRQTTRPGLQAIYERAGLNAERMTEEQIGFVLAPRLNALGRLGDANPAVELLSTQDKGRARLLTLELEGLNSRRQLLTSQVLRAALAQIEQEPALLAYEALVLAHPAWPAGVIGIVASRLVELLGKPTVLIAIPPGEDGRGSARSVEGVDITVAIAGQAHLLNGFGGHVMAAGFSIPAENITNFRRGLSQAVAAQRTALPAERAASLGALFIDGALPWGEINLELAESLERLAPFGAGNPPLALVSCGLQVVHRAAFGRQGEHLHLTIEDENGFGRRAVWWGAGDSGSSGALSHGVFDLAFTLRVSTYRGQSELQVTCLNFREASQAAGLVSAAPAPEIIDYRSQSHPLSVLQELLADTSTGRIQIWAEAEANSRLSQTLGGVVFDRQRLSACETLVVWTTPPGWAELQDVLTCTRPNRLVVFAVDPETDQPQAFLHRLAGLVKYMISKQDGWATLAGLAAATAQKKWTVRLGLEWLAAMGHITIISPDEKITQADVFEEEVDRIRIVSGGVNDASQATALLDQIRILLDETHAYRAYSLRNDIKTLYP